MELVKFELNVAKPRRLPVLNKHVLVVHADDKEEALRLLRGTNLAFTHIGKGSVTVRGRDLPGLRALFGSSSIEIGALAAYGAKFVFPLFLEHHGLAPNAEFVPEYSTIPDPEKVYIVGAAPLPLKFLRSTTCHECGDSAGVVIHRAHATGGGVITGELLTTVKVDGKDIVSSGGEIIPTFVLPPMPGPHVIDCDFSGSSEFTLVEIVSADRA